jgi:hypothetical protein
MYLAMGSRRGTAARLLVALASACAFIPLGEAVAARSVGTGEQIAWVRSAASRFLTAELAGDGAGACAVLNRPLRATVHGRTCATRWDARLAVLLRKPGERVALRRQSDEIARAAVIVHGNVARIELSRPLIKGPNKFLWTENCWMLEG